jgi:hypothetical protein
MTAASSAAASPAVRQQQLAPHIHVLCVCNAYARLFAAGHEFVGTVVECSQQPTLVGQRVVGEININCAGYSCADAVFQRNHAPCRWGQRTHSSSKLGQSVNGTATCAWRTTSGLLPAQVQPCGAGSKFHTNPVALQLFAVCRLGCAGGCVASLQDSSVCCSLYRLACCCCCCCCCCFQAGAGHHQLSWLLCRVHLPACSQLAHCARGAYGCRGSFL